MRTQKLAVWLFGCGSMAAGALLMVAGARWAMQAFLAEPALPDAPAARAVTAPRGDEQAASYRGFLYGRVTMIGGERYEGRLRFGGVEESFWTDAFNAARSGNVWAELVEPELLMVDDPLRVFGRTVAERQRRIDTWRPFMVLFGDLARLDASGGELTATLRSGERFELDRMGSDDLGDGVRVWDLERGVTDLGERNIASIEFLPTKALAEAPVRLHGTVRTATSDFTGFLQWDRRQALFEEGLSVGVGDEARRVLFEDVASVERTNRGEVLIVLRNGEELRLNEREARSLARRGVVVADRRYGRVVASWRAIEGITFDTPESVVDSGPGREQFGADRPLRGVVVKRDGTALAGRLVFDLDESRSVETLDAPADGVDYSVLFDRIATIDVAGEGERVSVTLRSGETLRLERSGDLGGDVAGMLVFADGAGPEYVPWPDVARVEFERP